MLQLYLNKYNLFSLQCNSNDTDLLHCESVRVSDFIIKHESEVE